MLQKLEQSGLTFDQRRQLIRDAHDELDIIEVAFAQVNDQPAVAATATAAPSAKPSKPLAIDPQFKSEPRDVVHEHYSAMLNQTNISMNNNKFFVLQVIHRPSRNEYHFFKRWGRVGEPGMNSSAVFSTAQAAIDQFVRTFVLCASPRSVI
jgi:poly [ADP-ribose] polymerase